MSALNTLDGKGKTVKARGVAEDERRCYVVCVCVSVSCAFMFKLQDTFVLYWVNILGSRVRFLGFKSEFCHIEICLALSKLLNPSTSVSSSPKWE